MAVVTRGARQKPQAGMLAIARGITYVSAAAIIGGIRIRIEHLASAAGLLARKCDVENRNGIAGRRHSRREAGD